MVDKDGCYPEVRIKFEKNLYLFYTGNVRNEKNNAKVSGLAVLRKMEYNFKKKGDQSLAHQVGIQHT